jgi:uncharacterized protein with HEPN domain
MDKDKERLGHILDAINQINAIKLSLSYDEFVRNLATKWALVKLVEIIGEACIKITIETKDKYHEIKWKQIAGTRHILVHDYNVIDFPLLWEILEKEIPILEEQVDNIYNSILN